MTTITEIPNTKIVLKTPQFSCDSELTRRDITPFPNRCGCFMAVIGTMGSGKTSFVISALTSKHVWRKVFDHIFVIMPPSSRASLRKDPFRVLKRQHIHDEMTLTALAEIDEEIDSQESDDEIDGKKPRNLLLIDDQTSALKNVHIQNLLRHMILNCRHKRLNIVMLSQYLNAIPLALRKNISELVICNRPRNKKEIDSIVEEFMGDMPKDVPEKLLRFVFRKKYDKLFICLTERDGPVYYRNLNRLQFKSDA